jgi:hypothetical protein
MSTNTEHPLPNNTCYKRDCRYLEIKDMKHEALMKEIDQQENVFCTIQGKGNETFQRKKAQMALVFLTEKRDKA